MTDPEMTEAELEDEAIEAEREDAIAAAAEDAAIEAAIEDDEIEAQVEDDAFAAAEERAEAEPAAEGRPEPTEIEQLEAAANDYLQTSGLCRKASERDANEGNTSGALANLTISHFAQLTSTLLSSTILVVRRLERIESKLDALRIEVDAIGDGVEAVEVRTR